MANRPDNFDANVTNVTPLQDPTTTIANAVGDVAAQAAQMSAAGKAVAATAQTQVQFRQLDSQFRLANADDPTNHAAVAKLQADRQAIVDSQSANVPAIAQRDFTNKSIELGVQSDDLNAAWATKQQIRNGVNGLQQARVLQLKNANDIGRQLATDPDADIGAALQYQQAMQTMHAGADPILGADKTGAFLKDFQADYTKSVIAGVAERNPQKAAEFLNDPAISQHFSTEDIGDMASLIQKTTKQQALIQSLQTTQGDGGLTDIVNDPNTTYFEKRAKIDQLDMQGSVSPKAASAARRVIKSSSDLDAQTDTPVMADILNQTYDLNAIAKTKNSDYLVGVQDIHQKILNAQASGDLTAQDASKITREVNNLMSSRLSDATTTVAGKFSDARKQFEKALPPEFRGDAVRQLFYATQGQNMTPQQVNNQAGAIIDKINKQRLQNTQSVLSRIGDDGAFLKTLGYTQEQVQQDASAKGMSYQQGIQALRNKYSKSPKRLAPSTRVAPQSDLSSDTSDGIRINSAPPASILNEDDTGSDQ